IREGMQCSRSVYISFLKCLMVAGTMLVGFSCMAQPYLAREISVISTGAQHLGDLLDSIGKQQAFYFSYNSDVVNADKQVEIRHYKRTLIGFLEQVFGSDYVFK